jgi:hypothetical protein
MIDSIEVGFLLCLYPSPILGLFGILAWIAETIEGASE